MNKPTRQITKVKHSADKTMIEYQEVHDDGRTDEYSLTCTDRPLPEFDAALQRLLEEMPDWCEIHQDGYFDNATVRGVSFSWKHGIMGAVVTLLKPLRHCQSPLVINAPHKTASPYSDGGDWSVCFTVEQRELLQAVIEQTEKYLDGERAQMELPLAANQ